MSSDIYDRIYGELRTAERKWSDAVSSRFGSGGILTTTGGGNGLTSGIVSVFGGGGRPSGIIRALAGNENVQRLNNVLNAINESFPAAFTEITKKLRGISIDAIKPILRDMLTDVALYLGGSTALGAGIGGGIGAFAFGAGAVPGAMVGGWLGFEIGNVIMALTGLKSVVAFMKDAVPAAVKCYGIGFKNAWGEDPTDTAPWKHSASRDIAMGHILFMMALLMGIVAYLTRGKGDFGALLSEVRASPKLGPKMAEWLEANKNDLLKNPELQPKASAGGGGAKDAAKDASNNIPKPMRGGSSGKVFDQAEKAASKVAGQIEYGSSDLSKAAQDYRAANGITGGRNVAVFEYVGEDGQLQQMAAASERGVGHAERILAQQLKDANVDPSQVTRIYSELQPCNAPGGYCANFINNTFPNANVTWSFEYGETAASRAAGVQALKDAVSSGN
jgi:hypothetical protein